MIVYGIEVTYALEGKATQRDLYFSKKDGIRALKDAVFQYQYKNKKLKFIETKPNVWQIMRINSMTGKEQASLTICLVEYKLHSDDGLTSNLDDFGDLMTMNDFIECCEDGGFIDYDGSGYYASETKLNGSITVYPSMVRKGTIDKRYTHIMWYNR